MSSRWDRDRFEYEQSRAERGRPDDDRYYRRPRDHSDERYDRRYHRAYDDHAARDRRYYDDEPSPGYAPRREPAPAPEYDRRPVMEREREPDYPRNSRPSFLRRQSSLDTFDRRPSRPFYEQDREEYPPPARREDIRRQDYRAPPYTEIPLPKTKTKALPAPRRYDDRYYEDIKVAEPDYYGDDDYRPQAERVQEREVVRTRRRRESAASPTRSHSTRTRSRRGSSPTSTATSRSSSSSGGTTIRSEYPKKGKTRIPGRLVSKRALIDLGYPYTEEGNTVIVQKALGQDNIDELLKLSEEYKKSEMEVAAARSSAGDILRERKEELAALPPPPAAVPAPPPPAPVLATPAPPPAAVPYTPAAPTIIPGPPPPPLVAVPPPPPAPVAMPAPTPVVIDARPPSPTTTSTSSSESYYDHRYGYDHHHHHHHERSGPIAVGPVALAERSRSRSRTRRDIRAEIKALERELVHRPKHELGPVGERELVHAERLPDGQLVVYEEQVEKVIHSHKPPRIEKDKKGRLSLSLPRH